VAGDIMIDDHRRGAYRIGVLSLHNSKETKAILNAVSDLGHQPVWLREANLTSQVGGEGVRFDPAVDVVVNRLLVTKADRPLDELGVGAIYEDVLPVLNPPSTVVRAVNKYGAATTLAANGIPVPDSYLGLSHETLSSGHDHVGERAVQKASIGTNGAGMRRTGETAPSPHVAGRRTFLQRYVESADRPFDLRVYVVRGEVVGAMRRYAPDDEWRTNVALGGEVEDATDDLPSQARAAAVGATETLGLDYAGVDLIQDQSVGDDWRVLEVNATAGFKGLFDATGRSPAPYIARAAIERVGGQVSDRRVADLATSLDDSVPACKPDPTSPDDDGAVGFTEAVRVGGGDGIEHVVAKSDTGAKRTCIDAGLAGEVGAGPIVGAKRVRSSSGRDRRPLVDVELGIDGVWRTVTASVADRSGMNYDVLLGRDVLGGRQVDVDRRVDEE
jgi:RimK family alpha-L-glutamate ligase